MCGQSQKKYCRSWTVIFGVYMEQDLKEYIKNGEEFLKNKQSKVAL
jgi:hypothetical protein